MLVSTALRVRWRLRCWLLNRRPGVNVSKFAYISKTADLQLNTDGFSTGGVISIAPGVRISDGVILAPYGGSIHLEENVYIGPYCVLYGHGNLTIGRNTLIASHTTLIPSNHIFDDPSTPINKQGERKLGIKVGEDVWIGTGVRVLDGVHIKNGCVIGAGSIVNKSLEPYSIAVGVPAKSVKLRGDATALPKVKTEQVC